MSGTSAPGTDLACFFEAASVAVVGASNEPTRTAGKPLHYLLRYGYRGRVYPVNPRHATIQGVAAWPSLAALPEVPELALILLPAEQVAAAVAECARLGVRGAVIFGNGFADAGRVDEQRALVGMARARGLRLLGPNCLGAVNVGNGLTASFSTFLLRRMFVAGDVALLTQSGSVGNGILMGFQDRGLGISKWIATGNEADLDVLDCARYVIEDPATRVLACFVESTPGGQRWLELGQRARALGKRIVVLKGGRGARSAAAIASHSGKLAGSYRTWRGLCEQAGIVVTDSIDAFTDAAYTFSRVGAPLSGRLAFLGTGGYGVLASDAADQAGMALATLSPTTRADLGSYLPVAASLEVPVDPTPVNDETYCRIVASLLTDPGVGAVLVLLNSLSRDYVGMVPRLHALREQAAAAGKRLALAWFATCDPLAPADAAALDAAGVLLYPDVPRAVHALSRVLVPGRETQAAGDPGAAGAPATRGWSELKPLLDAYGITTPASRVVASATDAAAWFIDHPGPAVFKLDDPELAHKTEAGGVILDVADAATAQAAVATLMARARGPAARVLVQQQARGIEVLAACRRDPEMGPVVMVGAGGILTELLDDVAIGPCPTDPATLRKLLAGTRVQRLLDGWRGAAPHDSAALAELVARLTRLFADHPELAEIELNPVIVQPAGQGALAVDVLAVAQSPSPASGE